MKDRSLTQRGIEINRVEGVSSAIVEGRDKAVGFVKRR